MNNILEVSGLNKSYKDFSLRDVSFSLPEGCITGFIGVNGAGKTTTLRSILGLTNRVSGEVRFFGMDMCSNEKQIKERIGIVLDDGCFYDELTLGEMKNVVALLINHGAKKILKNIWISFRYFRHKKSILCQKVCE
ncbi:ATP-binding cassette domain-containing protein [Aminipila terrae]|uniref:ATP-binding cassette domain-containing protein n=1 Tax=Aminipila terrae TaxID=2697030 RepID=UPI002ED11361